MEDTPSREETVRTLALSSLENRSLQDNLVAFGSSLRWESTEGGADLPGIFYADCRMHRSGNSCAVPGEF